VVPPTGEVDLHVELGKLHVSLVNATPAELLQLCVHFLDTF